MPKIRHQLSPLPLLVSRERSSVSPLHFLPVIQSHFLACWYLSVLKQFGQKGFFRRKGFALLSISLLYVKLYIAARSYLGSVKYELAGSCRNDVFNAIQRCCSKREITHQSGNNSVLLCDTEVGKNKQRLGLRTPLTVSDVFKQSWGCFLDLSTEKSK